MTSPIVSATYSSASSSWLKESQGVRERPASCVEKIQATTRRASHVPTREGIVILSSFMVSDVARDAESTTETTSPLDVMAHQPLECLYEPTMMVRRKEARDVLIGRTEWLKE